MHEPFEWWVGGTAKGMTKVLDENIHRIRFIGIHYLLVGGLWETMTNMASLSQVFKSSVWPVVTSHNPSQTTQSCRECLHLWLYIIGKKQWNFDILVPLEVNLAANLGIKETTVWQRIRQNVQKKKHYSSFWKEICRNNCNLNDSKKAGDSWLLCCKAWSWVKAYICMN